MQSWWTLEKNNRSGVVAGPASEAGFSVISVISVISVVSTHFGFKIKLIIAKIWTVIKKFKFIAVSR